MQSLNDLLVPPEAPFVVVMFSLTPEGARKYLQAGEASGHPMYLRVSPGQPCYQDLLALADVQLYPELEKPAHFAGFIEVQRPFDQLASIEQLLLQARVEFQELLLERQRVLRAPGLFMSEGAEVTQTLQLTPGPVVGQTGTFHHWAPRYVNAPKWLTGTGRGPYQERVQAACNDANADTDFRLNTMRAVYVNSWQRLNPQGLFKVFQSGIGFPETGVNRRIAWLDPAHLGSPHKDIAVLIPPDPFQAYYATPLQEYPLHPAVEFIRAPLLAAAEKWRKTYSPQAIRRRKAKNWIRDYGSERLRGMLDLQMPWWPIYLEERLARERPGWVWGFQTIPRNYIRVPCPPLPPAVDRALRRANETIRISNAEHTFAPHARVVAFVTAGTKQLLDAGIDCDIDYDIRIKTRFLGSAIYFQEPTNNQAVERQARTIRIR